jgi:carboxypeptidase Taq
VQQKFEQLKNLVGKAIDIYNAAALLSWDQQTQMPPGAGEGRSHQLGTLRGLFHEHMTSDEMGRLLEDLKPYAAELAPDSDEARLIARCAREYDKLTRVPADFVTEFARLAASAYQVWAEARRDNDFPRFRPYLERVVEMRRQYASFFAPYDHVFDPLLDDFEPGMKTADVKAIFEPLRSQQAALVQAITARPQVDDAFLYLHYDPQKQWDFGIEVITRMGYDWDHGRIDKAPHPFTQGLGPDDVRITTRILENNLTSALFSNIHEMGHALYELGVSPTLARTPLAEGASLAVHESQSRLWENLVGRSRAFWRFFYPRLQQVFPAQLGNVDMETFYKGINRVQPSLIRVEADEATYNLHIMLRMELEIALMEGSLEVADLPEAWNSRMQEYLGISPPDDSQGVLQDVHWSEGYFGYFPTYALGNLISAQLWECLHNDLPDLEEQIARGEFASLLGWLREKIHRHGGKFNPQDLVKQVTGSPIDAAAYMRYLNAKYQEIYGL